MASSIDRCGITNAQLAAIHDELIAERTAHSRLQESLWQNGLGHIMEESEYARLNESATAAMMRSRELWPR